LRAQLLLIENESKLNLGYTIVCIINLSI